jgi:hypothetical protein
VRPFTRITIIVLFVLLVVAAIAQFTIGGPAEPLPGPVPGTPLPVVAPSP